MAESVTISRYFKATDPRLTEGITYVANSQELFWSDIIRGEIHRVTAEREPEEDYCKYIISPYTYDICEQYPYDKAEAIERVGCVFPVECKPGHRVTTVLFGARYGIGKLNIGTGTWKYLFLYRDSKVNKRWERMRSNDGNVSPDGREIYIGVMNDFSVGLDPSQPPEGCFLRINLVERSCKVVLDNVYIPNAINWSPDNRKIYLTDSLKFVIWQLPFENGEPALTKSIFYNSKANNQKFESPEPDGSFVDPADGTLYTAVWSTGLIQAVDPQGDLVAEYSVPTPRVSSCCLGPKGDVFVSTAPAGDMKSGSPSDELGGSLYRISIPALQRKQVASSKRTPSW
ncbi:regucalcin Ecym_5132 [Eremothecium cymbalariae DBVPG|uniref:SMP-30/Gluconolactonase/LRE-like region domain-containing protein n=1 Tax=Eremothecium cymbalariae (strain CBS 270.75 / DBVPG 7215 / KCTC 17166 / NRRL Y-17582) TaxID=931890 RepID=I6NCW8_ERECY|nr:hypothetical protein Ecym_5132 [Eremothecium cymbalariae DBVPG\